MAPGAGISTLAKSMAALRLAMAPYRRGVTFGGPTATLFHDAQWTILRTPTFGPTTAGIDSLIL